MPFRRQPDQEELAARIRAAQGYAQLERADMAAALDTTPSTLDRKLRKRKEVSELTWQDAWAAADATGLPLAFFAADFSRLNELVPDDVPLPKSRTPRGAIRRAQVTGKRAGRRLRGNPQASPGTHSGEDGKETGG